MDSFYILSSLVLWGGNHPTKMGGLLIDGQMGYTKKNKNLVVATTFLNLAPSSIVCSCMPIDG